jgi:lipopolysaccharide cholinephosphotransferase
MYTFIIIIILIFCIIYALTVIKERYKKHMTDINFWKSKYDSHHDKMYKLIKKVKYYLEKHKIDYWIHAGTLLGYTRHNGIIPWDDDIDFGYLKNDNINGLIDDLETNGFKIENSFFGFKIFDDSQDDKLFVDMFEFTQTNNEFKQTYYSEMIWPKENYLYNELLPLKKCNFNGIILSCPNNPEKFCEKVYSKDYMNVFYVNSPHPYMFLNNIIDGVGISLNYGEKFMIKDLKNNC